MARIGWKMPEEDRKRIVKAVELMGNQKAAPAHTELKLKKENSTGHFPSLAQPGAGTAKA